MSRIRPQCLDANPSERSAQTDVLLREEPDEEEDDEEDGLVENPVELSLAEITRLGHVEHITMHHCIQGWSGIAKWGGIRSKR
ncbi:MAG: hypothetical protein ABR881_24515 [Candidatus Sulfotelmatobacter sp.]